MKADKDSPRDAGAMKKDPNAPPPKGILIEQAETRTAQANLRTDQANARTDQANTRTEEANTRTEQADLRTEKVETQSQALRVSEVSYRRLFEAARDGILILDFDTGRVADVNPFLVELLGFSHDEMVGKTVGELSPFNDIVANQRVLERLRETGYVRHDDLPLKTRDGRHIAVEFVSNVYQAGGEKVIQCNIRDITARKQVADELRWKTAILEAQVDSSLDGIWVVDDQGKQLLQNQRMRDLWKIPPHIADDKDDAVQFEYIAKRTKDPRQFAAKAAHLYSNPDQVSRDEIELIDGTILDCYSSPVRSNTGEYYGRIWTFRDVTEGKRAEESHARLAMAVEQAGETIIITDTLGTILYTNPAFEKSTGYTCAEVLGQNPRILKSGKQDAPFYRRMWDVIGLGEVWSGHFVNRRKDGKAYEEEATISPIRDASDKIVSYVAVKRDVTREVQLEAQFRQSQRMESIGQLAGGIAHDFNNILAVIMMQAELARTVENTPAEVRESLVEINAAAERAANLTRQLLLFSRQQVMQPRQLDLNDVVTSLAKLLQRLIREDVSLELHLHPTPLVTYADAGMLDQILMNLAVNARDAMPKGGRLVIETADKIVDAEQAALNLEASPGRCVWLSVSDTGCGISPEVLPRIFEPFFTTKEAGKGTGLGLATVFGIVKQHRGWLEVYSQTGKGTTFQIFLPASETSVEGQAAAPEQPRPRGGSETILVAEDDDSLRMLTRAVLERNGYHVLEAADGVEANRVWTEHQGRIALLLTDLVMPGGVDGRELAARLQTQRPDLKVVFTSGYSASIAGRELALKAEQHFVQKPCPTDQLLESVRNCLDR